MLNTAQILDTLSRGLIPIAIPAPDSNDIRETAHALSYSGPVYMVRVSQLTGPDDPRHSETILNAIHDARANPDRATFVLFEQVNQTAAVSELEMAILSFVQRRNNPENAEQTLPENLKFILTYTDKDEAWPVWTDGFKLIS